MQQLGTANRKVAAWNQHRTFQRNASQHAGAVLRTFAAAYTQHTRAERRASCGRQRGRFTFARTNSTRLHALCASQMEQRQRSPARQKLGTCNSQGCCIRFAPHLTAMHLDMQVPCFAAASTIHAACHGRTIPTTSIMRETTQGLSPRPTYQQCSCSRLVHGSRLHG